MKSECCPPGQAGSGPGDSSHAATRKLISEPAGSPTLGPLLPTPTPSRTRPYTPLHPSLAHTHWVFGQDTPSAPALPWTRVALSARLARPQGVAAHLPAGSLRPPLCRRRGPQPSQGPVLGPRQHLGRCPHPFLLAVPRQSRAHAHRGYTGLRERTPILTRAHTGSHTSARTATHTLSHNQITDTRPHQGYTHRCTLGHTLSRVHRGDAQRHRTLTQTHTPPNPDREDTPGTPLTHADSRPARTRAHTSQHALAQIHGHTRTHTRHTPRDADPDTHARANTERHNWKLGVGTAPQPPRRPALTRAGAQRGLPGREGG